MLRVYALSIFEIYVTKKTTKKQQKIEKKTIQKKFKSGTKNKNKKIRECIVEQSIGR